MYHNLVSMTYPVTSKCVVFKLKDSDYMFLQSRTLYIPLETFFVKQVNTFTFSCLTISENHH